MLDSFDVLLGDVPHHTLGMYSGVAWRGFLNSLDE